MKETVAYLFELIRCAIGSRTPPPPGQDVDLSLLFRLAKHHNIANILCYGLQRLEQPLPESRMEPFLYEQRLALYKAAYFENELLLICAALEENQIRHMPLKGSVIKHWYPSVDMRTSVDIDILFEEDKQEQVRGILRDLGYEFAQEGYNHDVHRKPNIVVEMHTSLISEKHSIYRHFENVWEDALLCENRGYEYRMTHEDFYVYTVAHLTKHFLNSGIGIRAFLDVSICDQALPLDRERVEQKLKEIGIYEFYRHVRALCGVWFSGEESTELLGEMASFVLRSGEQGTSDTAMLNELSGIRGKNTKLGYYRRRLFLPLVDMKRYYKTLNERPYLLGFFWVYRFFQIMFKKGRAQSSINYVERADLDAVNKVREMQKKLGLNR